MQELEVMKGSGARLKGSQGFWCKRGGFINNSITSEDI